MSVKRIIEDQCPQCGAPATLMETERILTCGFCQVRSCLLPGDYFRYVLPMRLSEVKDPIYVPYWSINGMQFSCNHRRIRQHTVNFSFQAIESKYFPASLKFRDQVFRMQFTSPEHEGIFLDPQISVQDVTKNLLERLEFRISKPVYHCANITNEFSLVYAPYFYVENELFDGILNESATKGSVELDVDLSQGSSSMWRPKFLPAICPNCSWDLEGDGDALVMVCRNCNSVWQIGQDQLKQLKFGFKHSEINAKNIIYVPFWRISAQVTGMDLDSYSDLVKITDLSGSIHNAGDERLFYFWGLGFKMRHNLIRQATDITVHQPNQPLVDKIPENGELYPVTLPFEESIESLKISLAIIIRKQSTLYPRLQDITITPQKYLLVYLPFEKMGPQIVLPNFNISFFKTQLYR